MVLKYEWGVWNDVESFFSCLDFVCSHQTTDNVALADLCIIVNMTSLNVATRTEVSQVL